MKGEFTKDQAMKKKKKTGGKMVVHDSDGAKITEDTRPPKKMKYPKWAR